MAWKAEKEARLKKKDLANQERIRILGEKEIYVYWEILEVDIVKQVEIEE